MQQSHDKLSDIIGKLADRGEMKDDSVFLYARQKFENIFRVICPCQYFDLSALAVSCSTSLQAHERAADKDFFHRQDSIFRQYRIS